MNVSLRFRLLFFFSGPWNKPNMRELTTSDHSLLVENLQPATRYVFRVIAESSVGRSDPTTELLVTTEPQKPGGPPRHLSVYPLSSTALRITWAPPLKELQHGTIQGYYVGYKEMR